MKKGMVLGIIGMALPMFAHVHPVEEAELQKIYVAPRQLTFADQGIFVYVEGEWVPVNAIHSDALGLYVALSKNQLTRWICKCGYNNYGGDETCQRRDEINGKLCGKPRPKG